LVLAFSTRGMFPDGGSEAFEPIRPQAADSSSIEVSEPMRPVGEEALFALFAGAAEAAEEVVLNALLQATATGAMKILPQGAWPEAVRAFQKRAP
jgi:L-aminopeptidase/D-esterase-like protein